MSTPYGPPPGQQPGYPPQGQQPGYPPQGQQPGYPPQGQQPGYPPSGYQQPGYQQSMVPSRTIKVRGYNERMAKRMAKRAKLPENGVAVAFTFNNLATMLMFSIIEDIAKVIPTIGDFLELAISLASFYWHRTVLVTDTHVYIYRDLPFHRPGAQLHVFQRGPGLVTIGNPGGNWFSRVIRRGQLTFNDGTVVYHGILWIKRAQYIAQEGNIPGSAYPQY